MRKGQEEASAKRTGGGKCSAASVEVIHSYSIAIVACRQMIFFNACLKLPSFSHSMRMATCQVIRNKIIQGTA